MNEQPADEISQKERREVVRNDRRVHEGSTYYSVAQASVDDERGGRYALESKQTVIGSSPIAYPQQPSTSPWSKDPVPDEPSLGYRIDDLEPVGEVFERGSPSPVAASPGQGAGGGLENGPTQSATQSKFRRRV